MFITGFTPSVVRASIMGIIMLGSGILHRKNDVWTSISFSLLVILIYNPFLLTSLSLMLSYAGTIGIITFYKVIISILEKVKFRNKKYKYKINKQMTQVIKYVKETLAFSISARICLIPIIIVHFNTLNISFIFTNIILSLIIAPIVILGFIALLVSLISAYLLKFVSFVLIPFLQILIFISKLGDILPFHKVYITSTNFIIHISYYLFICIFYFLYRVYNSKNTTTFQYRIRNIISLIKYKIRKNKKRFISLILIIWLISSLNIIIPHDLKIYFIDVGQGDSTLIVTPQKQSILIDGGGSDTEFDVGKNTLLPYLLDRKVNKIDYMIISHFDQDHVRPDF